MNLERLPLTAVVGSIHGATELGHWLEFKLLPVVYHVSEQHSLVIDLLLSFARVGIMPYSAACQIWSEATNLCLRLVEVFDHES